MKTAIIVLAVLGASMAQTLKPLTRLVSPVVHVSQPAFYHVSQPAVYHVAQPTVYHVPHSVQLVKPVLKSNKEIPIVSMSSDLSEDGSFNYQFEGANGIQSSASGSQKSLGADQQAQVVEGSFSYTAPDGTPIRAQYTADENGFRVSGDHLPTPPPIPAAIAKSLELLPTLEEFERQEAQRMALERKL